MENMSQLSLPNFANTFSPRILAYPKSPLRYPGGKARAVPYVLSLIPNNIRTIISPFLGGGSIEIAAASNGIQVFGFDIFQPLITFWKFLLEDPGELANEVTKYFPLLKSDFYRLQKVNLHIDIESAAIFYVLNRCSFSGSTLSGGMSPGHPRFTKSSIEYLRNFTSPNLKVECQDFTNVFRQYPDEFMYLDPPYMTDSALYGRNGDAHKQFDHFQLASLLKKRNNWLLSYNDCSEIRELYSGYNILTPSWKYGMSNNKDSREIIILNYE